MLDIKERPPSSGRNEDVAGPRRPSSRAVLALVVSVVAVVAAVVGAYGPADRVRTTYSWPPETLPNQNPTELWYTPLLLAARSPESMSAEIPCRLPPGLPGATEPTVVLATARGSAQAQGLAVTRAENALQVVLEGASHLLPLPTGLAGMDCVYRMSIEDDSWSIEGGPAARKLSGTLAEMPLVVGIFSALDLAGSERRPSIEMTTVPHQVVPTALQRAAWTVAAVALVFALLLVAAPRRWRRLPSGAWHVVRRAHEHAHPADAVVAFALLGWWVLAPAAFDDGWVLAREQMFASSGGFSLYYSTLGANLPLDYWVEWAHHWLVEFTDALLILRIPALIIMGAIWVLCRWMAARVTAGEESAVSRVHWTLASAFLLGAFAWGMTLRPEPVTALLVTVVAASMVRFLERETVGSVVVACVAAALALAAHTTGIVALAPLIVASPRLVVWARARPAVASTIVLASGALLLVLAIVGSDLDQRRIDANVSSRFSEPQDEFTRYGFFISPFFATPLRRAAVGLILLTVLAYVLRSRRESRGLLDFPAPVLAVSLVLFVFTPSKWAWHFGVLVGIGALAVVSETVRLHREGARCRKWQVWPFLAVVAAAAVAHWSWWGPLPWNGGDLRTLVWYPNLAEAFSSLALLVPTSLLVALLARGLLGGRDPSVPSVPWRLAAWTAPLLVIPATVYTVGILVADSVNADWTLARQNLETIGGRHSCGLGDDLVIPVSQSARALSTASPGGRLVYPNWVPKGPIPGLAIYALSPTTRGSRQSPWFRLPQERRFGLFVTGQLGSGDRLSIEWGRRVRSTGMTPIESAELPIRRLVGSPASTASWRLVVFGELPVGYERATAMRISYVTDAPPGTALAITAPVAYRSERLSTAMRRSSRTLVAPELFPYFPCAQLPTLSDGVVEPPRLVIDHQYGFNVLNESEGSPFRGVEGVFAIEYVSVADSRDHPRDLFVFRANERSSGAVIAFPDHLTSQK